VERHADGPRTGAVNRDKRTYFFMVSRHHSNSGFWLIRFTLRGCEPLHTGPRFFLLRGEILHPSIPSRADSHLTDAKTLLDEPACACQLLCRFVGRPSGEAGVGGRGRQASDKRQGTKSRGDFDFRRSQPGSALALEAALIEPASA
jgi:hypothetical protein